MADEPILRGAIINELWVAARYGGELTNRIMSGAGVDPDAYGPISFIGFLQPVTRTRLAEASGMRRTTIRDMVGRLIERGHVEETPNPRDGRSTLISLTPAGQEIFDQGVTVFQQVIKAIDDALDGGLREHEDAVRRVRLALQSLVD
jgi:DNA-binding MarR family transcriptional regulator